MSVCCVETTSRNVDWSGEQVNEQWYARKLFRHAGQDAKRGSAWASEVRSVLICVGVQHVVSGIGKAGPQTSASVARTSSVVCGRQRSVSSRRGGTNGRRTGSASPSSGHGNVCPKMPFLPQSPRMAHIPGPRRRSLSPPSERCIESSGGSDMLWLNRQYMLRAEGNSARSRRGMTSRTGPTLDSGVLHVTRKGNARFDATREGSR